MLGVSQPSVEADSWEAGSRVIYALMYSKSKEHVIPRYLYIKPVMTP